MNPTITTLADHDETTDWHWLTESRDLGEQTWTRIPVHYRDATADVLEVAQWVYDVVQSVADEGRTNPSLQTGPSLLLAGPTGTGKTYQAYGAVRALTSSGIRVQWRATTAADIYAALRPRHRVDAEEEFERFARVRLLVIDDLGAAKSSEWTEEINYRLINHRYEHHLATIFTTNVPLAQLRECLGERVASRLVEMTTRVTLTGNDRRRAA